MAETRVAVVGAGSWGTTLASLLADAGHDVVLWAREAEVAQSVNERGINETFLPGLALSPALRATDDLEVAFDRAEVVVWVCPVQHSSALLESAAELIPRNALLVSGSKGVEVATLRRVDEIFADVLPADQVERFCVLSGPSFAREVAQGVPTAVVVASKDLEARLQVQQLFQTDAFRVYTNPDVVGVELAGALKNVIAVAAGVVAGLGLGHNTIAALITRGLAEMGRLGAALGAEAATFAGLAGMGDLVLTCTGGLSRNRTVGFRLGSGESLDEILADMNAVAEGVPTAHAVQRLAQRHDVEMPISREVYAILAEGADPREAVHRLMTREPKSEAWV